MGQQQDRMVQNLPQTVTSQQQPPNDQQQSNPNQLETIANWFRQQMKLNDEQMSSLQLLNTAISSVTQQRIEEIIDQNSVKENLHNDTQPIVQGLLIEVILDEIIQSSNCRNLIKDVATLTNYFKQYLQLHRKINLNYINSADLVKELMNFKNAFPILDITTEQETEEQQDNQQEEEKEQTQLINQYKALLEEFINKQIESPNDLKSNIITIKQRLNLIESLLNIQENITDTIQPEEIEESENEDNQDYKLSPPNLAKRREKGLMDIFSFYSRQHILKGRKMNFEEIQKEKNTMNQGEFYKFCSDFNILLSKADLMEIYRKKLLRQNLALVYENFKEMLIDIFRAIRDQQIDFKQKDIKVIDSSIEENEASQSTVFEMQKKKKQLIREIQKLEGQDNFLEQAHIHLQTHNPEKYGKIMKGFQIPFGGKGQKLEQVTFLTASAQKSLKDLRLRASIDSGKQQKDETRERLREQSINRINQLRSQKQEIEKIEVKSYNLAQLRNIQNNKDILADNELETVLGIQKEQANDEPILIQLQHKDGYNFSFKPNNQQQGTIPHKRQISNSQLKESPTGKIGSNQKSAATIDIAAKNYHSKIMSRANQLEKVNSSMIEDKKKRVYDQHMKRVNINKSIIESYNDQSQQKREKRGSSVI